MLRLERSMTIEFRTSLKSRQTVLIHQYVARKTMQDAIADCTEKIRKTTGYQDSIECLRSKKDHPGSFLSLRQKSIAGELKKS